MKKISEATSQAHNRSQYGFFRLSKLVVPSKLQLSLQEESISGDTVGRTIFGVVWKTSEKSNSSWKYKYRSKFVGSTKTGGVSEQMENFPMRICERG